ncbi:hypothetical protein [Iningainema tapete]|uniref:hypothetical protein n=1 Tax=Iningainema tapete TaxID=2806730 RepID=UPI001EE28A82|nr:hypothetical protein [Iningainema tapete]
MTQPLILLDTNVVLYLLGGRLAKPLPSGQYVVSVITEIELLGNIQFWQKHSNSQEKHI